MSPSKDLHKIIEGQRQDVERGIVSTPGIAVDPEAHAGELLAGAWRRRLSKWIDAWSERLDRLGTFLKRLALVLGGIAGLIKLVHTMRSQIGPAELPRGTDTPTIGTDFVKKPKPPGT